MSATVQSVLRATGTVTIEGSETVFDPTVVATQSGLYVYESFVNRVRRHATPMKMECATLSYSDLIEEANDREIATALGEGYEFSYTQLCYAIHSLIAQQSKGEEGPLLTNGRANLFYVKNGPVVNVYWVGDKWFVIDWYRDDNRWPMGIRAFRN
jgi:hypothetical protein